ncbi:MAG: DMT family transporter [Mycobacteriales bacterium]
MALTATRAQPQQLTAPAGVNRSAAIRLGLLAVIWGTSFLLIKVALHGLTPIQIVLGRMALGAATLLIVLWLAGERLPTGRRTWASLAFVGVIANVVPFFLIAWGEQYVATGLAGIYNATMPLFTLLVATAALPEERPTVAKAAGLVVGFLGVLLVMAPWRGLGHSALAGQLACLGAAACYAVAITYTRRYLSGSGYPPVVLAAGQLVAATVVVAALVPFWVTGGVSLPPRVLSSVVALGALGTGIAYLLFYRLIGEIGATAASTVTYLVPVVAVSLGVAVLGEAVAWNDFVGAAVVLVGVAVAGGQLRRIPALGRADVPA